MGRVHRPARGRRHRRRPAARLRLRLERALQRRRDRPQGRAALPDRPAAVPGRGRSSARRADARASHRQARRFRAAARRAPARRERDRRTKSTSGGRRSRDEVARAAGGRRGRAARGGAESRVHARDLADRRPRRPRDRHRGQPGLERPGRSHAPDDRRLARSDLRVLRRRRADLPPLPGATRRSSLAPGRPGRSTSDPHGARQRRGVPARGRDSTSSTTSSIRRPAPSAAAPCSATRDGALTPGLFVRLRLAGGGRLPRRADPGPRRRHRSRQEVRARRRTPTESSSTARSRSGRSSTACASCTRGLAARRSGRASTGSSACGRAPR